MNPDPSAPPPWPAPGATAWISAHAAGYGLFRVGIARVMANGGIEVKSGPHLALGYYRPGEFHPTREAACHAAVKVVVAAIAEHQRSIDRLQGLASDYARQADGEGEAAEESPECLSYSHSS